MWPDRILNPGPLTYESGALPTALRGPAIQKGGISLFICLGFKDYSHTGQTVCALGKVRTSSPTPLL